MSWFFGRSTLAFEKKDHLLITLRSDWTVGDTTYPQDALLAIDLDDFLRLDGRMRELIQETEKLKHRRNTVSKEISSIKKSGGDAADLMLEMKNNSARIKSIDHELKEIEEKFDRWAELDEGDTAPPFDLAVTNRPGTRFGPAQVREMSVLAAGPKHHVSGTISRAKVGCRWISISWNPTKYHGAFVGFGLAPGLAGASSGAPRAAPISSGRKRSWASPTSTPRSPQ